MAADNIMEVYLFDAYLKEEPVSAIRHGSREQYGADILFNRYESMHFRNNTVWEPPEWATYMYAFIVGAGGGGGSGNGGNTRGGLGGDPGSTHVAGYYLDGTLKGQPIGIAPGSPGLGGTNGNAGQAGRATIVEIGSYTSRAMGGSGGAGGAAGSATSGGIWRHQTDAPQRARLNRPTATTITRGVAGASGSGGNGTNGNGGGGGSGGIFGVYNNGGDGGQGFVDIHFWGIDPYD